MTMSFMPMSRRAIRVATVAAALAFAAPASHAQPQPSPAAMAAAKEIVSVTGATTLFDPLIPGVIEQSKILFLQSNPGLGRDLNEISATLRTELTPRFAELVNEVAHSYATHFTEQELKEMLAFYKSPVGIKFLNEQPKVVDASLKFAQTWANTLSEQVTARMRDELRKRGHKM